MSVFVPTSVVDLYRSQTTQNIYGETLDDNSTPAASGVRVAIMEGWKGTASQSSLQTRSAPGSMQETLVEVFTIRFRPDSDVQEGDRVHDTTNDLWFQVTDVVRPYTVVGYADIRARATRIGDYSQPVNG